MSRLKQCILTSLVMLAGLAASGPARAEYPVRTPYVGASGGYNLRLRDWDWGKHANTGWENRPGQPESSAIVSLRLGYQLKSRLAVELAGGYLPTDSSVDENINHGLKLDVTVLYHLTDRDLTPYVSAGGGTYFMLGGGGLGSDLDPLFHVGVGVRGLLRPWVAFRAEVRDVISDGFDRAGSNNLEFSAGLDFFIARPRAVVAKVLDSDGDSVADADDRCPTVVGKRELGGCPDADSDGVLDSTDKCPTIAGKPELGGCPDSDGDGVADPDDKCPTAAGKRELGGCPDSDGDGVLDSTDKCPTIAGKPELGGCPDSDGDRLGDAEDRCPTVAGKTEAGGCPDADGDGVPDFDDKCPKLAGKRELGGCPDRDNDGVADAEDKCPDQTGMKEHHGCLPKEVAKFTGAIPGITFETGKAEIAPTSFPVLDSSVKVLQQFPSLRMRIEGHTDDVGHHDDNQKLSQARADAVKAYFVSKGVDAKRLESVGYGDSKPKKDNKTEAGRAANRRIEFAVIQ